MLFTFIIIELGNQRTVIKKGLLDMRYVTINEIKSGMILASTLYNNSGTILLNANKALTPAIITRLKSLGYNGLYIYDDMNTERYEMLLDDDTRIDAIRNLKHINIDNCLFIANKITNEILKNPDVMYELMTISSYDNITYMHSVNVAILATMIGVDMGLDTDTLYKLSQAALLHDIGKTMIDYDIINKDGKLDPDEIEEVHRHPYYGYMLLKNNPNVSSIVRNAIYSHHENEDGSGYPRGIKSENIHITAKIIHVADVYDALTSQRSYKERYNPSDAIEFLLSNTNKMFNENVVKALMSCVALYPIGTEVKLSDGRHAIVTKNHRHFPTRPKVMLADGEVIDLMKIIDITIVELITEM